MSRPLEPTAKPARRPHRWVALGYRPEAWLVIFGVLFFQGCRQPAIQLTAGPFVPFVQVDYLEDFPFNSALSYFSLPRLLLNLAAFGALWIVLPVYGRGPFSALLRRLWRRRETYLGLMLVSIAFNMILVYGPLWLWTVYHPTIVIADLIHTACGTPDDPLARESILAAAARVYFFSAWGVSVAAIHFTRWVFERYVFTEPDRWWQYNLRSLLALTFLVGSSLGILLRFWRPD